MFLLRQGNKVWTILWSAWFFFVFIEKRGPNRYCLWEENLVFLMKIFSLIYQSVNLFLKNSSLVCWSCFRVDTKIICGDNFVASLRGEIIFEDSIKQKSRSYQNFLIVFFCIAIINQIETFICQQFYKSFIIGVLILGIVNVDWDWSLYNHLQHSHFWTFYANRTFLGCFLCSDSDFLLSFCHMILSYYQTL